MSESSQATLSVLAGNPLLDDEQGHSRPIDLQLKAFKEAIQFASENRERLNRIYVAFDHLGPFDRFLKEGLSGKRKKKPKLCDLTDKYRKDYEEILEDHSIESKDIHIITEHQARNHMLELIGKNKTLCQLVSVPKSDPDDDEKDRKVLCNGITTEILRRIAGHSDEVEAFVEERLPKRCRVGVFQSASMLAREELGIEKRIRVHMLPERPHSTWKVIADTDIL